MNRPYDTGSLTRSKKFEKLFYSTGGASRIYETGFCNFLFQKLQNRNAFCVAFLIEIKHFYQKAVLKLAGCPARYSLLFVSFSLQPFLWN